MKFFAGLLSIACFSTCISASAAASQTHSAKPKALAPAPKKAAAPAVRVAPADEYFGGLKMSILGIRNTLKDLAQKADYNPSNPEQIFGSANFYGRSPPRVGAQVSQRSVVGEVRGGPRAHGLPRPNRAWPRENARAMDWLEK